jgi:hypothetical protein
MIKRFVFLIAVISYLVVPVHSMRTPLSQLPTKLIRLKSRAAGQPVLEASNYLNAVHQFEKNRIFFLIDPWIEARMTMG